LIALQTDNVSAIKDKVVLIAWLHNSSHRSEIISSGAVVAVADV
jgi:hypothetical protein